MALDRRLLAAADRGALCAEVAERLQRGELVALPTETVYGLAVLPSHAEAVGRVRALKLRDAAQPFTWHLADARQVAGLQAVVTPAMRRLMDRYWPGPLTLILPTQDGGSVGVRVPAHEFTRAVIAACGQPLWLTSLNERGKPPLITPDEIAARFADDLTVLVDAGVPPLGVSSTIVRATGAELEVLREGILTRSEVLATAAETVLFVCTGNTCRSPLAEALARQVTATALGTTVERVLAHGLRFESAGTSTVAGMPASEGSLLTAAELELDLSQHRTQPLQPDLWRRAARIYCLGDGHRRALLAEAPEVADKISMLRPDGLDIADPYGGDLSTYRRVRNEILAAVTARLKDWLPG